MPSDYDTGLERLSRMMNAEVVALTSADGVQRTFDPYRQAARNLPPDASPEEMTAEVERLKAWHARWLAEAEARDKAEAEAAEEARSNRDPDGCPWDSEARLGDETQHPFRDFTPARVVRAVREICRVTGEPEAALLHRLVLKEAREVHSLPIPVLPSEEAAATLAANRLARTNQAAESGPERRARLQAMQEALKARARAAQPPQEAV